MGLTRQPAPTTNQHWVTIWPGSLRLLLGEWEPSGIELLEPEPPQRLVTEGGEAAEREPAREGHRGGEGQAPYEERGPGAPHPQVCPTGGSPLPRAASREGHTQGTPKPGRASSAPEGALDADIAAASHEGHTQVPLELGRASSAPAATLDAGVTGACDLEDLLGEAKRPLGTLGLTLASFIPAEGTLGEEIMARNACDGKGGDRLTGALTWHSPPASPQPCEAAHQDAKARTAIAALQQAPPSSQGMVGEYALSSPPEA